MIDLKRDKTVTRTQSTCGKENLGDRQEDGSRPPPGWSQSLGQTLRDRHKSKM